MAKRMSMAVPDFQSLFLPFLQLLKGGEPHHVREIEGLLASELKLSDEDLTELLPSKQSTRFANRVGWARTHLFKAGLLEQVERAIYRISPSGTALLATNPKALNLRSLDEIPQHKNWFRTGKSEKKPPTVEPVSQKPANEIIEDAFEDLNTTLAADLREKMGTMDPFRFEQLVVDLLFAMGYGGSREEAAKVTKKTNDEGIDGVINEDRLGLDVIYIQAKRWKSTVGRVEIQNFVGALAGQQSHKGIFITTSDFARTAVDYARSVSQKVILIDGVRLTELMIEHGIGVSVSRTLVVKRIDSDYFESE